MRVCEQGLLALGACDREQDCVCVYFSPVCRGIIFNVCVSRLYPKTGTVTPCCCHCLVHETPVLNKLNKTVAENQTKAVSFCLFSGRACRSGVYLLITSPIFPQMWLHVPSHAAGLYVRFRKIKLTLLILLLSLRATICAAYLDAPPETLIIHIGIHILLLCLTWKQMGGEITPSELLCSQDIYTSVHAVKSLSMCASFPPLLRHKIRKKKMTRLS